MDGRDRNELSPQWVIETLHLEPSEVRLLYGRVVYFADSGSRFFLPLDVPPMTLFELLSRYPERAERLLWSLLEEYRKEPSKTQLRWLRRQPVKLYLKEAAGEWSQVHGTIRVDRVHRAFAVMGYLHHSRFEEWERGRG